MLENHKSLLLSNLADLGPECLSLFSVRTYSFPPWVFRHTPSVDLNAMNTAWVQPTRWIGPGKSTGKNKAPFQQAATDA